MKKQIIYWLMVSTIMVLGAANLRADSSTVYQRVLTVERMHLQEVFLTLRLESISHADHYFIIKKSKDGVDFHSIFELDVDKICSNTLVLADHISDDVIVYYQLVKVGSMGEEILTTTKYDPNVKAVDPSLSKIDLQNPNSSLHSGDPHAL